MSPGRGTVLLARSRRHSTAQLHGGSAGVPPSSQVCDSKRVSHRSPTSTPKAAALKMSPTLLKSPVRP